MEIPRIVIAGAQSGVGKTTITLGLIGALKRRGYNVQPFKIGPDYIDPSYHTKASGNFCRNLDSWMLSKRKLIELFTRSAARSDVTVIEGVMGLFDGLDGLGERASTAEVAKLLKAPVILIIDVWGMARSVAAAALGYKQFDKTLNVAGVILNRVSGQNHAKWCKDAVESGAKLPVIACLPNREELKLKERHLGLIPTSERKELEQIIPKIVDFVDENTDLEKLLEIARHAPGLRGPHRKPSEASMNRQISIGVAFDEAFCFYYRDALEQLESQGGKLCFFSPLHDKRLPEDISGVYIGGGFPEVLAWDLSRNGSMRFSVKQAAEAGMPIFAECGGLMYLTRSIRDLERNHYPMVGVLDAATVMDRRLCLGYTLARVVRDNILSQEGDRIRGHEYHYSRIVDVPKDAEFAYQMDRGVGIDGAHDGWLEYSVLASYSHTHFASKPKLARSFVKAASVYSKK